MNNGQLATGQPWTLAVLGLSHKVAPIALREPLNFSNGDLTAVLPQLAERLGGEVAILSTCNRVEIYVCNAAAPDVRHAILAMLGERSGIAYETLDARLYSHHDAIAVRHLFSVAAGLDSILVGEPQILGQVRRAWLAAHDCGTAGPGLSRLFQNALRVGKLARTETRIGQYHVSLGHAATALARGFFNGRGLSPQNVLIIGAGQVAETVACSLTTNGLGPVMVANRNFDRATALAASLHGRAIRFSEVGKTLRTSDVVISSSNAPHYVLYRQTVEEALQHRSGRPLCLIDIAVPRDIEPAVAGLPGIYLRNIDDLQHLRDDNLRRRQREADRAARLVAGETTRFMAAWQSLPAVPVLRRLRQRAEIIRQADLERTFQRLPDLTAEQKSIVEAMSKRMINEILHPTLVQLREPDGGPPCANYLECVSGFLGVKQLRNET